MTARSVSWTDAKHVASLLSQVAPAKRAAGPGLVRSMGQTPGGTGGPKARPPAPPPKPAAVAAPPAVKAPAPKLEQTADNPSDRLDLLLAWTMEHHDCTGAFVADDNGLTLAAHGISEAHVSIVGPLLSALLAIRSVPGIDATAGALWLGPQMMSWVEVRTERAGFCLGVVGAEALPARALDALKEALEVTVRGL